MKFEQKIKIYGISALTLGVIILLGIFFGPTAQAQRFQNSPLIPGFTISTASQIKIGDFEIKKSQTGDWTVYAQTQDFPAENEKVTNLLKTLEELKVQRIVSTSGENQENYGFSTGLTALVVMDKDGKTLASLDTGSVLENGRQVYVKVGGSTSILVTDRNILSALNKNFNQWTNLNLFVPPMDEKLIIALEWTGDLKLGDKEIKSFRIERKIVEGKETWVSTQEGFKVEDFTARLPQLLKLRAQENGLISQSEFSNLPHSLKITYGTSVRELKLGNPDTQSKVPVEIAGKKLWLSEYAVRDLLLN